MTSDTCFYSVIEALVKNKDRCDLIKNTLDIMQVTFYPLYPAAVIKLYSDWVCLVGQSTCESSFFGIL